MFTQDKIFVLPNAHAPLNVMPKIVQIIRKILKIATWGYFLLNMSFVWISRDYQWIIGILGPFMREFEIWQFQYLSNLAATKNPQTRAAITMALTQDV